MARKGKELRMWMVNGWLVETMPNTFAEQFRYTAEALTATGHRVERHGFQTKTAAFEYAQMHVAPTQRVA